MSSSKKIVLTSSDGETFYVDEAVAVRSQTIKRMIEVDCADSAIPLPNVTSSILAKVIQYCEKHVEIDDKDSAAVDDALKVWDAEFVKVEQHVLYALIMAANYLDIQSLVDFTCQTVADMLKGKTNEEMREILNINNDPDPRGGGALGSRLRTLFMSSFFWMFLMLVVILVALK